MGIQVISECFVKPRREVEAAKQPHYLGLIDLGMLSIGPIQKGLLFPLHPNSTNADTSSMSVPSLVDKLRRCLSAALVYFYPLAGRFATQRHEEEHACWIYLDCNKGPGARLIHAAAPDLTVPDILSPPGLDVPEAVNSLFDLGERMVNHDCHTRPVLSIQVTELRDGVFFGFTISHSVADGTSLSHFITALSDIFRADADGKYELPPSRVPLYKQLCPDGCGPAIKLPYLDPEEFITRYEPGPLRERIFHFSPASMASLKARANAESQGCGCDGVVSSFVALSALVWRSITRARALSPEEGTSCVLPANARPRLDPPLSDSYFGNYLGPCRSACKVGELSARGLGWAAMLLRQGVKSCNHKLINDVLKFFAESPAVGRPGFENNVEFYGPNPVVIGGSARFDMYGPEFGLGRAVAVRMGFANKENAKVTANPGREGGGSVDLEICLRPEIMSALESDQEFMSLVSQDEME